MYSTAPTTASTTGKIVFPMVDLDQQVELNWIVGMRTNDLDGRPVVIEHGVQQTKLRINLKGAHVESAVAIAMVTGMQPDFAENLVIDRPFFCWIERDGVTEPGSVFALAPDDPLAVPIGGRRRSRKGVAAH